MEFFFKGNTYPVFMSFSCLKHTLSALGGSEISKMEEILSNVSFENFPQLLTYGLTAGKKRSKHNFKLPTIQEIEDAMDEELNDGAFGNYMDALGSSFKRFLNSEDTANAIEEAVKTGN